MLPKYTIEYCPGFSRRTQAHHYSSDDPIACEEFLAELLDRGFRIMAIRHEGVDLPRPEFDRFVKTAAGMVAARRVCSALNIKPEEEKYRFGFAA
ncbi:MAG: hypothetical protein L0Y58_01000 [Verrucomicrobia subdivision 3 bacterium]|nr:hypothetical protein [Limisphaerales bacterium]